MKSILFSRAKTRENETNTLFPIHCEVKSFDDMRAVAMFDHVCGSFEGDKLDTDNFISTDCVFMDCDNGHTDNPDLWLTPDILHIRLEDVPFYYIYSRNHMKEKKGKSARPRFHVIFPLEGAINDPEAVRMLKEKILAAIPEFDQNAKDTARKFFGVENPDGGAFEGTSPIDVWLSFPALQTKLNYQPNTNEENAEGAIKEGTRNSTLFYTALSLLATNENDVARAKYEEAAKLCVPPLPDKEVEKVWRNAVKYSEQWEDKPRGRKAKKQLTPACVEKALQACNINLQLDVFTRRAIVSGLPLDSALLPDSYRNATPTTRRLADEDMLPLFLTAYLKEEGYSFQAGYLYDTLSALAQTRPVNHFLDIIKSTTWDKKDRITDTFIALGYSPDSPYYAFYVKWLWQAISMTQNDDSALANEFALVLQGPQGCGKTSFFRQLAMKNEFFKEGATIDTNKLDTLVEATSVPITELGELDSTLGREQSALKAFLNRREDEYRAPYGRHSKRYPRRTVFCGTVNPAEFLRDNTGSRRFVVIPVTEMDIDFILGAMTPQYCAQLWRQVYDQYYRAKGREGFYLTRAERAFSEGQNVKATVPVEGETQLWDLLDWDADPSIWVWKTNSEIVEMLRLKITANQMGRALSAVMMKDSRVIKQCTMSGKRYKIPPRKGNCGFDDFLM